MPPPRRWNTPSWVSQGSNRYFHAPLNVDGVGQDQPGERRDRAGREELFDLPLSLFAHPVVDADPAGVGGIVEVHQVELRPVVPAQEIDVSLEETVAELAPEGIGRVELDPSRGGMLGDREVQGVEGRMEPLLGEGEVEGLGHLGRDLAPGAGVGHCQRQGDAVGREEEVPLLLPQTLIKLQGEGRVSLHQRLEFLLRHLGRHLPRHKWSEDLLPTAAAQPHSERGQEQSPYRKRPKETSHPYRILSFRIRGRSPPPSRGGCGSRDPKPLPQARGTAAPGR